MHTVRSLYVLSDPLLRFRHLHAVVANLFTSGSPRRVRCCTRAPYVVFLVFESSFVRSLGRSSFVIVTFV